MKAQSKIRVFLVHGTFASDADWIKEESKLSQALKEEFHERMVIKEAIWSGENSFKERSLASKTFADKLVSAKKESPDYKNFAIGHSHGGTVILNSLKALDNELTGAIFMGTPFLVKNSNKFRKSIKYVLGALIFLLTLTILNIPNFITELSPELTSKFNSLNEGIQSLMYFLFIVAFYAIIHYSVKAFKYYRNYIANEVSKFNESISIPSSNIPVLNLQYKFDEATLAMKVNHYFFVSFKNGLNYIINRLDFLKLSIVAMCVVMVLTLVMSEVEIDRIFDESTDNTSLEILLIVIVGIFGMGLAFLFYLPFSMLWGSLSFSMIGFGTYNRVVNIFNNVHLTKDISEFGDNIQTEFIGRENSTLVKLNHSNFYSDDVCIRRIISFIKEMDAGTDLG